MANGAALSRFGGTGKLVFPERANNRLQAIGAVLKWTVRKKGTDGRPLASYNAARDVPLLNSNNPNGYHTWTVDEVRQFEERHPMGTKRSWRLRYCCTQRNGAPTLFG